MRRGMSLLPKVMSHWWETLERPHRMFDQYFAQQMSPEFMVNSFFNDIERRFPGYMRFPELMREDKRGWSEIKSDKDKFHVALDVQQFKPEEINVKVVDNFVVVEGKHEEKHDDHGTIARHFIRKYMIPEQCIPEKASCSLSSDGILTITAPRKPVEKPKEHPIKVEYVQKPAIENKSSQEENAQKQKISAAN